MSKSQVLIIKNVRSEGPGMMADFLVKAKIPFSLIELEAGDVLPEDFSNLRAVIVLGGPMNVYEVEKYPFLEAEERLIKKIIKAEIPFLGICLGAQLLAKAAGARVYPASQKEVGWYNVKLTTDSDHDQVFSGLSKEFPVFQWHGDTFDLPDTAKLLVKGGLVRHQAFKIGTAAYGLQFHVEVDEAVLKNWFKEPAKYIKYFRKISGGYRDNADKIFAGFFSLSQNI